MLDTLKGWFKNSTVILLARLEAFSGLAIGALSAMDWTQLLSIGIVSPDNWKGPAILASALFAHGLVLELARRRSLPA